MLHWYEIEPKQCMGQCTVAKYRSIRWALSSNAKTEGFAALTSSLPPTVGGDRGEGDVEAEGDERRHTGDGDDPALSSPGLHPGARWVLEGSGEGAGRGRRGGD